MGVKRSESLAQFGRLKVPFFFPILKAEENSPREEEQAEIYYYQVNQVPFLD